MLLKDMVRKTRKILEKGYTARCSVKELREIKREDFSTTHVEIEVYKDIPCRLSFQSVTATKSNVVNAEKEQVIKLFLAPDVELKPGSKIRVTQNNVTTDYVCSSEPAVHETHQEVEISLLERWA